MEKMEKAEAVQGEGQGEKGAARAGAMASPEDSKSRHLLQYRGEHLQEGSGKAAGLHSLLQLHMLSSSKKVGDHCKLA